MIIEMILVKGGTFQMGDEHDIHWDACQPVHSVTLSDFEIGKYPVTQREWIAIMDSNPSHFKGDNLPVENVSWDDCQEFLKKLNEKIGKKYRLPTEAEWEYAARGGNQSKGFRYSGSNSISEVAWFFYEKKTHPVGEKKANELGIHDMGGNVNEWCDGWFRDYRNTGRVIFNPKGDGYSYRVYRGGSLAGRNAAFPTCRTSATPYNRLGNGALGFRLALSL